MKATKTYKSIRSTNNKYWPTWFNIENYDCFKNMKVGEFLNELEYRLTLIGRLPFYSRGKFRDLGWEEIQRGKPSVTSRSFVPTFSLETKTTLALKQVDLHTLTQAKESLEQSRQVDSVMPLVHSTAPKSLFPAPKPLFPTTDLSLPKSSALLDEEENQPTLTADLLRSERLKESTSDYQMPFLGIQSVLLSMNLQGSSDHEIMRDVAYLLPQLRKLLNCPEAFSDDTKKTNVETLKKLRQYKAIPYLDLMFHFQIYPNCLPTEHRPSNSLLCSVLHGEDGKSGTYDELHIQRTHRPFIDSLVMNSEAMNNLFSKLRKDEKTLNISMALL